MSFLLFYVIGKCIGRFRHISKNDAILKHDFKEYNFANLVSLPRLLFCRYVHMGAYYNANCNNRDSNIFIDFTHMQKTI